MEKIVEQGILYDFYGELLTDHQRKIYEAAVFEDLSLSELAEMFSISRQGVHDLIKRCDKAMLTYESKLHLIEKSKNVRARTEEIITIVNENHLDIDKFKNEIQNICEQIIEEM